MRDPNWYIRKGKALDEAQSEWDRILFDLRICLWLAFGTTLCALAFDWIRRDHAFVFGVIEILAYGVIRRIACKHFVDKKLDEIEQKFAEEKEDLNGE